MLALIALPTITAFSSAAQLNGPRIEQYDMHEFAVSLLEERVATRDLNSGSGVYEDRFAFEITAMPYSPDESTRYDDLIGFTQLTVTVDILRRNAHAVEVSQIIAHAAVE